MSAIKICLKEKEAVGFVGDIHFDTVISSRLDDYLETCCKKIEAVGDICLKNNVRYLFFAGDIFNRVQCGHECVNRAGQSLLKLKNSGIRLFSICGNHDLPRDSLRLLGKAPLETLFSFGVMEHISLETPVEFYKDEFFDQNKGCAKITAVDFTQKIPKADRNFDANVLLAHMFFDKSGFLSDEFQNILKDKMAFWFYDMAFLGHDHEEFPVAVCGNTLVVRTGSLLRTTSHNYNFVRKPHIVICDDIFKPKEIRKVFVPCAEFRTIVSQAVINQKELGDVIKDDKEMLQELAGKLSDMKVNDEDTEDAILKIIETDTSISDSRRGLLLSYIQKVS